MAQKVKHTKKRQTDGQQCCSPGISCKVPREELEDQARIFKAIGNPARLEILSAIANHNNDVCACDFEELVDLSQPTVSHHIKILMKAGLVEKRKDGTWNYYRVRPDTIQLLRKKLLSLVE